MTRLLGGCCSGFSFQLEFELNLQTVKCWVVETKLIQTSAGNLVSLFSSYLNMWLSLYPSFLITCKKLITDLVVHILDKTTYLTKWGILIMQSGAERLCRHCMLFRLFLELQWLRFKGFFIVIFTVHVQYTRERNFVSQSVTAVQ